MRKHEERAFFNIGLRFYCWLYYRCYRYSEKANGRFAGQWFYAACYMSVIFLMNMGAFFLLTAIPLSIPVPRVPGWVIYIATLALLLLYVGTVRYKRIYHQHIVQTHSRETPEEQRRGDRLFGWYLVGSLIVLLGTLPVLGLMHIGLKPS